jgi:uncharacterized damage-inducible protein DinB
MHNKAIAGWPDTYAAYDAYVLIAAFEAGPERLREAIEGLSDEELTARPRLGKWSIKEIVPHVTDSEVQATFRIRMALAQQGVVWPIYDQDIWAKEHAYQSQSPAAFENSLRLFEALRAVTVPLLRRATAEDWRKHGVHPEFGPMTLRNLLELYADHSERHISQILLMRTMIGRPLNMPLMLEERLF